MSHDWYPSKDRIDASIYRKYADWIGKEHHVKIESYDDLWNWSISDIGNFWWSVIKFFDIACNISSEIPFSGEKMPEITWFPGVELNFTENVFNKVNRNKPAIIHRSETHSGAEVSWAELEQKTLSLAGHLQALGVKPGDRVVGYLPNIPETVISFLACAAIGAIWSNCSPDMGDKVLYDRYHQIAPKVLIAVDSYSYGGTFFDRTQVVEKITESIPSIERLLLVNGPLGKKINSAISLPWQDLVLEEHKNFSYERFNFSHPLWILYSSGTTGLPKAMVHSHGGIAVTHLKEMVLHNDLQEQDRILYLGSSGWAIWNLLVGSLLTGATIVLYDGNPFWPDKKSLWDFVDENEITHFGSGAAVFISCKKFGIKPNEFRSFSKLRTIMSTGSPLPKDCFAWIYENISSNICLSSASGGTDIASCIVGGNVSLPVKHGFIQCKQLGVESYAFNAEGKSTVNEVGELVVTKPIPSMPVYFWGDDGSRYKSSYFDLYDGVWRQGDWIEFNDLGESVIFGRSDSTINRGGVRIGTAEIYRAVEEVEDVVDSLVVDLEYLGKNSFMPLFVVLKNGAILDEKLKNTIVDAIKKNASPKHVPNDILEIKSVPRTISGKKMEVPIRKILLGHRLDSVLSLDNMQNPESIVFFIEYHSVLKDMESV